MSTTTFEKPTLRSQKQLTIYSFKNDMSLSVCSVLDPVVLKQDLPLTTFCRTTALRATLTNNLRNSDGVPPVLINKKLTNTLLYGNQIYDDKYNTMQYIKDSQIFDESFFNPTKILLTFYIFYSVSHFNTHKM